MFKGITPRIQTLEMSDTLAHLLTHVLSKNVIVIIIDPINLSKFALEFSENIYVLIRAIINS